MLKRMTSFVCLIALLILSPNYVSYASEIEIQTLHGPKITIDALQTDIILNGCPVELQTVTGSSIIVSCTSGSSVNARPPSTVTGSSIVVSNTSGSAIVSNTTGTTITLNVPRVLSVSGSALSSNVQTASGSSIVTNPGSTYSTSEYIVTIPKTINLDKEKKAIYSVKVAGSVGSDEVVEVKVVDDIPETLDVTEFYMVDGADSNERVPAVITHIKEIWTSDDIDISYEETDNTISAGDITAGTWSGTFLFSISLKATQ